MTVWSVTPFFGELDVLEIRLATLDAVVDRHVVVESLHTQRGEPKGLVFKANEGRFAGWRHKISYVATSGCSGSAWDRERHQRDACMLGMDPADDDLVFLSDADEIPDPACFATVDPSSGPVWVGMSMHMFNLNWRWQEVPVASGTRATFVTGAQLRERPAAVLVEQQTSHMAGVNGWHLAYQGGVEAIQAKIRACADFEDGGSLLGAGPWQDHWASTEHLERCIATGADPFDREFRRCEWVGLDQLPAPVQENPARWAHMLADPPLVAA